MHNLHNTTLSKPLFRCKTSKKELQDLVLAWLGLSIAFTILLMGSTGSFLSAFIIAVVAVGSGFLLHELAHKMVAQYYDCWAEFRADYMMLGLAIALSFGGFIFAAPGAVMITGYSITREINGKISLAGPLTNYVLALLFLALFLMFPSTGLLFLYGFMINSWLGLFNLLPFGNFDGVKILYWNKLVYGLMVGFGIILLIVEKVLPYLK